MNFNICTKEAYLYIMQIIFIIQISKCVHHVYSHTEHHFGRSNYFNLVLICKYMKNINFLCLLMLICILCKLFSLYYAKNVVIVFIDNGNNNLSAIIVSIWYVHANIQVKCEFSLMKHANLHIMQILLLSTIQIILNFQFFFCSGSYDQ